MKWHGRDYGPRPGGTLGKDVPNVCLSAANACLYGVCEAAILAAGYAPSIGFLHTGKARSFVFDVGDILKFDTVTPLAFKIASEIQTTRSEPCALLAGTLSGRDGSCRSWCRSSRMC